MRNIAIIGAGVVGATVAYYLAKEKEVVVTVFDEGTGQATKAAAGIIAPWFSKRRHKAWYRMARLGADFYQQLVSDLQKDGFATDFYQQSGVLLLKKDETKLKDLLELAQKRRKESEMIGDLVIAQGEEVFPQLAGFEQFLFASGAARVDGAMMTETLLAASQCQIRRQKVTISLVGSSAYLIDGQVYDSVILACGAWLGEVLAPLGYDVDVRPQKGQLQDYFFEEKALTDFPVIMPEGEVDIIPFANGKVSVGASHENALGFDLRLDSAILERMEAQALTYFPKLKQAKTKKQRVGTRAYTSDFAPFFGQVPDLNQVFAASGLGSSGLTTGPIIAKQLVDLVCHRTPSLDPKDYPIKSYVKFRQ